jgi:hypothetical protein
MDPDHLTGTKGAPIENSPPLIVPLGPVDAENEIVAPRFLGIKTVPHTIPEDGFPWPLTPAVD